MTKKLQYVPLHIVVEWFDASDLITESPSEFDGVGYIPEDWFFDGTV